MSEFDKKFVPIGIRTVDQAVKDWFEKTLDVHVKSNEKELKKVPVVFSQGERFATGRTKGTIRDENGVLMLPVIAIRRTSIEQNLDMLALGTQTENIQIARVVDPKTGDLQSLESVKPNEQKLPFAPIVYEIHTIPFPDRILATYELSIQTQYISQMNEILEKMWRMLDIQRSFVMPINNDGRKPPRANGYKNPKPMTEPYFVGFFEENYGSNDNFQEMTDQERVIKYSATFKVPAALSTTPDGTEPIVRIERTAYKFTIPEENVHFVDDPAELDKIFGNKR